MTVLGHALKPHREIGKQRTSAVPAQIVRVPGVDETGRFAFIKTGAEAVSHGRYGAIVR